MNKHNDTLYLLIKVTVNTPYKHIHNAISELQRETNLSITSTNNVQVLKTEIMELKTK
ncbi:MULTISPECIES: hypothetical protein [Mucilaginibacter]|uniref:ACT domain-containing protein n=1 Tax=Mucilaginibacter rubeus TaxID=2027860 RepID=A0ABX7U3S1_9SPHI|nr:MULTISPECIES: hypothetical protein [Mucilaginibacter]QTE40894.1 hypothetical protein J3L19_18200 [Mucilaginibacter rubeus]QTE47497.1 hypothetical protein J3L21_18175 [Mucilaginibacter rubeus]QTE58889.1 hypothetical protein J3L23_09840 [Mucilaginibacter rubeus]QTE61652.1 hypothetical protein J3L22_24015 [Mucilaginibacter rubeus]QTF60408.1 hypothetical protein J3L20_23650 [Mucilaginibacter rubeus]